MHVPEIFSVHMKLSNKIGCLCPSFSIFRLKKFNVETRYIAQFKTHLGVLESEDLSAILKHAAGSHFHD